EEVVLNVQGFVLRTALPPIISAGQLTKNPSTAKQSLVLTGLGCELFDRSVKAVIEFHSRLASHLPTDSLTSWKPLVVDQFLCLELSNRYVTPSHLAASYDSATFDESIDPFGLLRAKVIGQRTDDNIVLYYERILDHDKSYKYLVAKPVQVKVGHIVEAQVSFCAVPISKGRYMMLSKLRSVCILDQTIYKMLKTSAQGETKRLKRKIGYNVIQGSDDATQALKRMRLGQENSVVIGESEKDMVTDNM
ncbi:hypothetical protein BDY19DRAFT_900618, partial [Irpex rosettiformis]